MSTEPSVWVARVCLIAAALLWSISSLFMRLLSAPLGLGLEEPQLTPLQIAFFRGFFGGLLMLILLRREHMRFHPAMLGMVATFTIMSGLYLSALGLGAAANAIFLQNTAPMWVYVCSIWLLGERPSRRGWQAVCLSAVGAGIIVAGGWPSDLPPEKSQHSANVLLMGLGSGFAYAGVILFLRALRVYATTWLVTLNLLGTAGMLAAFVLLRDGAAGFYTWVTTPTPPQLRVLIAFGLLQMALPYYLFTRGLRTIPAAEAALIGLLEPVFSPLWAYLLTPETDTPTLPMLFGGGLILLAILWRYVPMASSTQHTNTPGLSASSTSTSAPTPTTSSGP
ncbi:MAG: DMT family transporter [Gemmataceae bacterium]|nr:DMT family transporter [Gemmataceae bacterium]